MTNDTRQQTRALTEDEVDAINTVKMMGQDLINAFNEIKECPEATLAKQRVQEGVMWAVRGLTG